MIMMIIFDILMRISGRNLDATSTKGGWPQYRLVTAGETLVGAILKWNMIPLGLRKFAQVLELDTPGEICLRSSGVLWKGQHSWNISATKQARMDPKVVLESLMECPFRGIFFCP